MRYPDPFSVHSVASFVQSIRQSRNYRWYAASVLGFALVISGADMGAVNVAMPTIADSFGSNLETVQWIAIGNMVAVSAFLMPMGRLSDLVGRKKLYVSGIGLFVIGAGLAGLAPNLETLIGLRVLQGVGMGMSQGNQMAIMTSVFPPQGRGTAMGMHVTSVGPGIIIGPAVGGILVDLLGWRSLFYLQVPLAVLYLIPCLLVLDEGRISRALGSGGVGRFDMLGAILSAAALVLFLLGMTNPLGLDSTPRTAILVASALLLVAFVGWERRFPNPILDISLFKVPSFSLNVAGRIILFIASAPVIFFMPFYLQGVAGYSTGQTGAIMMSNAFGMIIAGPLAGRLSDRFGARPFNVAGSLIAAAGLLVLSRITPDGSLAFLLAGIILPSWGMGIFSAPNSSSILTAAPSYSYGATASFLQLLRNASTVTGIAIGTLVVVAAISAAGLQANLKGFTEGVDALTADAFVSGLRTLFLAMAAVQLTGAAVSLIAWSRQAPSGQ